MSEADDLLAEIFLSEAEIALIASHPEVFGDNWNQVKQAILLREWPLIMHAQVSKAKTGDTMSAKFLTDFVEPLATEGSGQNTVPLAWEEKALALRDKLGLEISGEILVLMVLTRLETLTGVEFLEFLEM